MPTTPAPARRLGRPPNDPGAVSTVQRLLDAAFAECVEQGFDGVVLANVAARAGVTANAVYKHFDSKSALLVTTAKYALKRLPVDDATLDSPDRARALARAFLAPEARLARRFLAELVVAAPRHPDLAQLMARWNDETLAGWPEVTGTAAGRAKVKALYVLLLGACQLEALDGIDAPLHSLIGRLDEAAAGLFS